MSDPDETARKHEELVHIVTEALKKLIERGDFDAVFRKRYGSNPRSQGPGGE